MSSKVAASRPLHRRGEQQIPSAHQSGAAGLLNQQPRRPAAARILCSVLTRLQAAAAVSDLLGNELSISHRSLEMYRPTQTRKSCHGCFFNTFCSLCGSSSACRVRGLPLVTALSFISHLSCAWVPLCVLLLLITEEAAPTTRPPADTHRPVGCSHFPPSCSHSLLALYCDLVFFPPPTHKLQIFAPSSISAANKRSVSWSSLT